MFILTSESRDVCIIPVFAQLIPIKKTRSQTTSVFVVVFCEYVFCSCKCVCCFPLSIFSSIFYISFGLSSTLIVCSFMVAWLFQVLAINSSTCFIIAPGHKTTNESTNPMIIWRFHGSIFSPVERHLSLHREVMKKITNDYDCDD